MIGYCIGRPNLAACWFRKTKILLREGARRLREGKGFSGVVYAHQLRVTIGQMVEDLELIATATSIEEWLEKLDTYQSDSIRAEVACTDASAALGLDGTAADQLKSVFVVAAKTHACDLANAVLKSTRKSDEAAPPHCIQKLGRALDRHRESWIPNCSTRGWPLAASGWLRLRSLGRPAVLQTQRY